uniref:AP2/ERF domain-containing protein n=1 Tax=Euplotes crassus TaxID=5936 RepID=A0A7S3KL04_EUPCR|mmetsp:Transcript_33316/g.32766  ORF Transcript_33316/g.32766 Transcript_33316/m.32766 type:complete len:177 (+) Transcript_33316:250-780(+)
MQKELTDLFIYKKQQTPQMTRISESISFPKTNIFKNEGLTDTSEKAEVIKKRRRRSSRLEIRSKLIEVRDQILQQGIPMFYNSPKKTRGSPISNSRRSKYIGISKNNTHWQALINIGRTKKYIDIFVSEQEAARTYDVYAIAIKGVDANLNFNYTAAEMISMIDHYLQHGSAVVPS